MWPSQTLHYMYGKCHYLHFPGGATGTKSVLCKTINLFSFSKWESLLLKKKKSHYSHDNNAARDPGPGSDQSIDQSIYHYKGH